MKSWFVFLLGCICFFHSFGETEVRCETVRLPVTIDLPLLRNLIIRKAYPDPGETARILDRAGNCVQVVLAEPQVAVIEDSLRFQTDVRLKLGTPIGEKCFAPFTWEGAVVLWQTPRVDEQWNLSFDTHDSDLLDRNGQPAKLAGLVWDQVKDHIHGYLQRISIDLAPPVADVKNFLLPLFDRQYQEASRRFLASMRPEQPVLSTTGLKMNILAEAETTGQVIIDQDVAVASPEALATTMDLWQNLDALLIGLIGQFSGHPLTGEDRFTLLNTMLTVRYAFEETLSEHQLTNAFVREQFLWSWSQLEPVFRRHLLDSSSENLLGYLAFFTAADALVALDRIGPEMGIEISRDGFHRLAELIGSEPLESSQSNSGVNTQLREILGLGQPPETVIPEEEEQLPPAQNNGPTSYHFSPHRWGLWRLLGASPAWAGEFKMPGLRELRAWAAETAEIDELLTKVRKVLQRTAKTEHKKLLLTAADSVWFDTMVTATAWQESCFRQFHVQQDKLTYLLSYNHTSVGLMQVNERVWRGIYDRDQLRWNVHYNAQAGVEILSLYLNRYIKEEKAPVDLSSTSGKRFLAVWLYSLYNGGPSQLKKLPKRHVSKNIYQSEKLFLAKYDQVKKGGWINQVDCL